MNGLWKERGFPHKGWNYIGFEDRLDVESTCQVCGRPIRYIHSLNHINYGDIETGSECAKKLAEEYSQHITANEKISEWIQKKHKWWINQNGNYKCLTRMCLGYKFDILVYLQEGYWKARYKQISPHIGKEFWINDFKSKELVKTQKNALLVVGKVIYQYE